MAGFNWGTALGSAGNAMQAYQNYQQQQLINQQNQEKLNAYMQAQSLSNQISQGQLAAQQATGNIAAQTWQQIQQQYGAGAPAPAPGQNSAQQPSPATPPQQVPMPNAAPAPQASQAMPPQGQMSPGMQFLMGGQGGAGMAGGAQAPAVPGASPVTGMGMQNAQGAQQGGQSPAGQGMTGLLSGMPAAPNLSTPNDVIGYYNQRAQAILQNAEAQKRQLAQIKPQNQYEAAALLQQYNGIDTQARAAVNDLTKERDATLTAVKGNTPTAYQQMDLAERMRHDRAIEAKGGVGGGGNSDWASTNAQTYQALTGKTPTGFVLKTLGEVEPSQFAQSLSQGLQTSARVHTDTQAMGKLQSVEGQLSSTIDSLDKNAAGLLSAAKSLNLSSNPTVAQAEIWRIKNFGSASEQATLGSYEQYYNAVLNESGKIAAMSTSAAGVPVGRLKQAQDAMSMYVSSSKLASQIKALQGEGSNVKSAVASQIQKYRDDIGNAAKSATGVNQANQTQEISSQAEYDSLPNGASYTFQGQTYTKGGK